jgi:hypothetical protein
MSAVQVCEVETWAVYWFENRVFRQGSRSHLNFENRVFFLFAKGIEVVIALAVFVPRDSVFEAAGFTCSPVAGKEQRGRRATGYSTAASFC